MRMRMMGDFGTGDKRIAREYCNGGLCTVVCIFMNCGAGCASALFSFLFYLGKTRVKPLSCIGALMYWGGPR